MEGPLPRGGDDASPSTELPREIVEELLVKGNSEVSTAEFCRWNRRCSWGGGCWSEVDNVPAAAPTIMAAVLELRRAKLRLGLGG